MAFVDPSPDTDAYDDYALVAAVGEVCNYCSPHDPENLTQARFNDGRAAAGHPDLPEAKHIAARLRLPWRTLTALATDPERDIEKSIGTQFGEELRPPSREEVVAALLLAAPEFKSRTADEYTTIRAELLAADSRKWRHGRQLHLPNANQIRHAAGDWDTALGWAGLPPVRRGAEASGIAIVDALERCVEIHGALPIEPELRAFARAPGFALTRPRQPWNEYVRELRARRRAKGLATPALLPKAERPDFTIVDDPNATADFVSAAPSAKRSFSDEDCVEAVIRFLDWLETQPSRERRPTQVRYRRFHDLHPDTPAASTIGRFGGLAKLLALARKERRSRRARKAA
jgi:hypothetical protein